jgi:hypothetical protein
MLTMLSKKLLTLSAAVMLMMSAGAAHATSYEVDPYDPWESLSIEMDETSWHLTGVVLSEPDWSFWEIDVTFNRPYSEDNDWATELMLERIVANWDIFVEYAHQVPDYDHDGSVPEPSAALVFGAGSLIVGAASRRRRRS